nr:lipoprotein insertase outer membrane protein LolB [Pseudomarimonas arenosa]
MGAAGLALLLVACARAPIRGVEASQAEQAQQQRELTLQAHDRWRMSGRVAVSANGEGGSGAVLWVEHEQGTDFELRAPVTGRSWRLQVREQGALIEGLEGGPLSDPDPQRLLRESVGWDIPLSSLRYWVRGARAPGPAQIEFAEDGWPARIEQQGWTVEFREWMDTASGRMPKRVFASRGDQRVRLAASRWQFEHG